MPGQGSEEKTEKATPKKREDERKKGNVFLSKDVITVVTLITGFFTIGMFFDQFLNRIQTFYYTNTLRMADIEVLELEHVFEIFREIIILMASTVLLPMLLVVLMTVLAVMVQTKMLVSGESIKFKMSRINPITGLKKLISIRSFVELLKSLVKIILLIWLLYSNISNVVLSAPNLMDMTITQGIAYTGAEIMSLVYSVVIAFGTVAVIDYFYQRWEYEKNVMMTKQEIKDEYKQMEGNPEIKGARRRRQQEMAQRRMMSQVKDADIVVRNPTHYAVALRYRSDEVAPVVLAKGVDHIALRIVEEAEKHGVATVENRGLARSLYELSELDQMIPPELYQPVAELMAWLYTTKQKAG